MKSLRQQLIEMFPPPSRAIGADAQLGHSLQCMLWSLGDADASVDGWTLFRVTGEASASLDAAGLMTLLPSGSTPISLHVEATDRGLSWRALASLKDESWLSQSDSKRWNNVYLFAAGELADPPWEWDRTYTGTLPNADAV